MWLGDGGRWQPVRLPPRPSQPATMQPPAEAAARLQKMRAAELRSRGGGTAGRHSRCRWLGAHRPYARLFRPDRHPVRHLQPSAARTSAARAAVRVIRSPSVKIDHARGPWPAEARFLQVRSRWRSSAGGYSSTAASTSSCITSAGRDTLADAVYYQCREHHG